MQQDWTLAQVRTDSSRAAGAGSNEGNSLGLGMGIAEVC